MNYSQIIAFIFIFQWTGIFAQPVLELKEVKIKSAEKTNSNAQITKIQIEHLNSVDLGDAVSKLPGVQVKSYGGVNGMKTIQVRGLGGQHTMVVLDGFPLYNAQAGLMDLSNIPMDFIEHLQLIYPLNNTFLLPTSSLHASNLIVIKSNQNSWIDSSYSVKAKISIGSFGFQDYNYLLNIRRKKIQFNTSAKFRSYTGNYPYTLDNYAVSMKERRKNNDLKQLNLQASLIYKIDSSQLLRINYNFFKSQQGLPGATILYAQTGAQNLKNDVHLAQIYYEKNWKSHQINTYHQYQHQTLVYEDPNYLNAQHFLKNVFQNQQLSNGINYTYQNKTWFEFNAGYESQFNQLNASHISNNSINRLQQFLSLSGLFKTKIVDLNFLLNQQYISDANPIQNNVYSKYLFNPSVSIAKQLKAHFLSLWYKNAVRLPSFNELYYQNIGNTNLKPEKSNQLVLQYIYNYQIRKNKFFLQSNLFFNQVNNKIVSIPSKNLFVWTIMNVEKVNIYGLDLVFQYNYNLSKNWRFDFNHTYSYQRAIDYSNDKRNQIAYTPIHNVNAMYILQFKNYSISYNLYWQSKQYALNENIEANEVEGYFLHDISLNAAYKIKKHQLSIHLYLKNLANNNYFVVKNYYMPGRNFTLSLQYEVF